MEQKIFLEKNRSVFSSNVGASMDVALSSKTRLLPINDVVDNFSLLEQYNRERDECKTFRMVLTVNPVCTNVLFNTKSEIIINEGSSACTVLFDGSTIDKNTYAKKACNTKATIEHIDAIRNTEYSHTENGGFIYHCGIDIFNNHLLRKKEFVHINKMNRNSQSQCGSVYNTIRDYCRDDRGDIVEQEIGVKYNKRGKTKMHVYQYDNIMSMPLAFSDNCFEKDGWWGFTNPGTIEIPNSSAKTISINRMMANNKPCEFIDLYPDRSLYSFIPKFNKHKRRLEKNWDYCLTYPYKIDTNMLDTICGGSLQAIKANIKFTVNPNGQNMVECSSYFKHNLKSGDYVTFYYYLPHYQVLNGGTNEPLRVYNGFAYLENEFDSFGVPNLDEDGNVESIPYKKVLSTEFVKHNIKIKVRSIGDMNGDNEDRVFSVRYDDIKDIYEHIYNFGCFYKKNSGGSECLYYFRKFKKIKSFNDEELKSDVNKIAFGKNIYGDDVAQVVFTDDIDISNLLDHNGKPVSELFFTIVKRNAGYKEWYEQNDYNNDIVEYSHCFGKVTSGIDFCGIENEPFDYNIHRMHNVTLDINNPSTTMPKKNTRLAWGDAVYDTPNVIEDDITIDFDEFFGDIVEYDVNNAKETVIGNVYHRFNTAQRETWNSRYRDLKQDVITSDDYDKTNGKGDEWKAETYFINNVSSSVDSKGTDTTKLMFSNISPEGYFYNPHIRIKICEEDENVSESAAKYINYTSPTVTKAGIYIIYRADGTMAIFETKLEATLNKKEGDSEIEVKSEYYKVEFVVPVNYGFYKGDYIALYNNKTMEIEWGEIIKVNGNVVTLSFSLDSFKTLEGELTSQYLEPSSSKRILHAYWSNDNVPTFAKLSEKARKFTWRNIVLPSKMTKNAELFDLPFANGRFYLEKNVNFFVKRQDPDGKYGLSFPMYVKYGQTIGNPLLRFNVNGYTPIDFSNIMFNLNNLTTNCF